MGVEDLEVPKHIKDRYPHLTITYRRLVNDEYDPGDTENPENVKELYKVTVGAHLTAEMHAKEKPTKQIFEHVVETCCESIRKQVLAELDMKNTVESKEKSSE